MLQVDGTGSKADWRDDEWRFFDCCCNSEFIRWCYFSMYWMAKSVGGETDIRTLYCANYALLLLGHNDS